MTPSHDNAVNALNIDYLNRFVEEASRTLSHAPADEIASVLMSLPVAKAIDLWSHLHPDAVEKVVDKIPENLLRELLSRSEPVPVARMLTRMTGERQDFCMNLLAAPRREELRQLLEYPENSAGSMMDTRFLSLRGSMPVRYAMQLIRQKKPTFTRQLFLVNDQDIPVKMIEIQDLALASPEEPLENLARDIPAVVLATTNKDEVIDIFTRLKLADLPVIGNDGRILGVIRYDKLANVVQEEASVDIQTMFGASKDETALSPARLVIRKRLPWLQINLATAFLAAAVVGIFEDIIAQFTALAVLLPVVAGQSGNTGAQALAVTMRGLALHEIGTSQWKRVLTKETKASLINGVAVALTTALGVYLWSRSTGLAMIITCSMVIAMVAAAVSGVIIPIMLRKLGQDPAQSSSIILTTVTDVTGFFAFLGIATLLSRFI